MRLTSLNYTKQGVIFNIHGIRLGNTLMPVEQVMEHFVIDGVDGMYETWSYLYDNHAGTVELTLNEKEYTLTESQWRDVYGTLTDHFIAEEIGSNILKLTDEHRS
ncbi:MAG: hypothetical protein ACREAU_00475 [Nitrosopumilaceae archaeon]